MQILFAGSGRENGRVVTIEPEMIGDLLICIFKMAAQREFGSHSKSATKFVQKKR
jgi:hypothetical protein